MPIFINYNKITLASFTVDSFTIWQMVKKEVNMEVMFILGAVGFMQELQVSDKIWESI